MRVLAGVVLGLLSAEGKSGQGCFRLFANRAGKGSERFVLGARGLLSLLTESQEEFCRACQLRPARRHGGVGWGLAQQRCAASTAPALQSELKGCL